MIKFKVGDIVTVKENLFEGADEYQPAGFLARAGQRLIIREIKENYTLPWTDPLCILVSHVNQWAAFVVRCSEIELIKSSEIEQIMAELTNNKETYVK